MILKSIFLQPFAGTANKQFAFTGNGINEVNGPNEIGKSTLARAIHAALYTPVKLGKLDAAEFIRNIPIGGDQAKIILEFSAMGNDYILEKTWGNNPVVKLSGPGLSISESKSVQDKLSELIGFQEGTYKNVFYVSQAELSSTSESIRNSKKGMDSLEDLIGGGQINYGNVSWTQMKKELSDTIDVYFDHWDISSKRPEGNREINNPWKQNVGKILKSYYLFREYEATLREIHEHELNTDICRREITQLNDLMKVNTDFVTKHKPLINDLRIRAQKDIELTGINNELGKIKAAMARWPKLETELTNTEKSVKDLETEIKELSAELENSLKAAQGKSLKEQYQDLLKRKTQLDEETEILKKLPKVSGGLLEELEDFQEQLRDADIKLAAQKLTLHLLAKETMTVSITDPVNGKQEVQLGKGIEKTLSSIPGLFELTSEKLSIKVSSEAGSAEQLATLKEDVNMKIVELLQKEEAASIEELNKRAEIWADQSQKVTQLQKTFNSLCEKKPFDTLKTEVEALAQLPTGRSVEALTELKINKSTALNTSKDLRESFIKEQQQLEKDYQNNDALFELLGKKMQAKTTIDTTLGSLKKMPEGFSDSATFFNQFSNAEAELNEKEEVLSKFEKDLAVLESKQFDQTAEEINELVESSRTTWERSLLEGDALICLRDAIEKAEETAGGDPFADYRKRLVELFAQLTGGKYGNMTFSELLPTEVYNDTKPLPAAWLSQGARDSLALAIRLAMAEYYLNGREGFLVMDDPMTNMDKERKGFAAECLKSFAAQRQVIMFSCAE